MVNTLALQKAISFLGHLKHENVIALMQEADIFTLPSWNEGFGIVYLEAMACGKPVIACKGEGIEDVVKDGVNGFLVQPKNLNDLVSKLDKLIVSHEIRIKVGSSAKELVMKNCTWDQNATKTLAVYNEVLSDAKR